MTAQPESILNQLVEQLSKYAKSYTKPDEFTLRRLKNEATMLMKVNAAEGAMIRGMIACLEGDLDECEKQHGISIKLNHDPIFLQNYALSLAGLGKNSEAYGLIKDVLNQQQNSLDIICLSIEIAFHAGYFSDVLLYQSALKKLKKDNISFTTENYIKNAQTILNTNLPESIFPKMAFLLESICLVNQVVPKQSAFFNLEDGLFQWVETTADVGTTVAMNFELAEALAIREDLNLDGYTVAFRAFQ